MNLFWFRYFNNNFLIFPSVWSRSRTLKAIFVFLIYQYTLTLTILIMLLCGVLWYECLHRLVEGQDVVRGAPHPRPRVMDGPASQVNVHTRIIAYLPEHNPYQIFTIPFAVSADWFWLTARSGNRYLANLGGREITISFGCENPKNIYGFRRFSAKFLWNRKETK